MKAAVHGVIQSCLYLNGACMGLKFDEFYDSLKKTVEASKDLYMTTYAEFAKLEQPSNQ